MRAMAACSSPIAGTYPHPSSDAARERHLTSCRAPRVWQNPRQANRRSGRRLPRPVGQQREPAPVVTSRRVLQPRVTHPVAGTAADRGPQLQLRLPHEQPKLPARPPHQPRTQMGPLDPARRRRKDQVHPATVVPANESRLAATVRSAAFPPACAPWRSVVSAGCTCRTSPCGYPGRCADGNRTIHDRAAPAIGPSQRAPSQ